MEQCLFSFERKNLVREGDIAIFYESMDLSKQVLIKKGAQYQTTKGVIAHDQLIDFEQYGTKVYTTNKRHYIHILKPSTDAYTRSLAQRTQILYTPDISQIIFRLALQPGSKVCESGTGSGSLSTSITKLIFPTGHLYTFEFNAARVERAIQDFKALGLDNYITVTHRDVLSCGFLLDDKVTDNSMDAVFLDLPSPHMAVKHAYQVLRAKGRLCNFSPCIEQVQRASLEMARQGFYEIVTIECLNREFDVRKTGFREIPDYEAKVEDKEEKKRDKKAFDKEMLVAQPITEIRGHTGYLTFAIKF